MITMHLINTTPFAPTQVITAHFHTEALLQQYSAENSLTRTIIRVAPEYALSVDTNTLISEVDGVYLRAEINRLIKEYTLPT